MDNTGGTAGPSGPSGFAGGAQGSRKPWEQQLNEAGARLEDEVRRVVRYVDEEVVPEVRRNGSRALRIAADRLSRLAQQMEERSAATPPPPSPTGPQGR